MSEHSSPSSGPPLPDPMSAAVARTILLDARGPSAEAARRAGDLARLLPKPAQGGWRAWFDRAAAHLATPMAPPPALAGVRRATAPRILQWQSPIARVEVEMEQRVGVDGEATTLLQGQVESAADLSSQACPVAALAADGSLIACTVLERSGFFSFEAHGAVGYLALALPGGTLILDPPAPGTPRAGGGSVGEE